MIPPTGDVDPGHIIIVGVVVIAAIAWLVLKGDE